MHVSQNKFDSWSHRWYRYSRNRIKLDLSRIKHFSWDPSPLSPNAIEIDHRLIQGTGLRGRSGRSTAWQMKCTIPAQMPVNHNFNRGIFFVPILKILSPLFSSQWSSNPSPLHLFMFFPFIVDAYSSYLKISCKSCARATGEEDKGQRGTNSDHWDWISR